MIDMSRDLRPYQAAVASQNPCHCLKSNVIPGVTSDRMLRLARSAEFRQEPWARLAGTSSAGVRLDCAVVRIRAVLVNPIGLGAPPTLAQPPGQPAQRDRVTGGGRPPKGLLGVGLPPRPPAQPDGQLAQRDRVTGGGRLPKGLLGV